MPEYDLILGELVHETKKAFLIRDEKGQYWIPKSLFYSLKKEKGFIAGMVEDWFDITYLPKEKDPLDNLFDETSAGKNKEVLELFG